MTTIDFLTSNTLVSSALAAHIDRRSIMKKLAGAGAVVLSVRTMSPALANHTSQTYTVSANANFRSGPGTNYSIISVIYKGATFMITGLVQNGYAQINYQSKTGWVLDSLVVGAGSTPSTPAITGVGVTLTAVNLRSGPGTSYAVLRVVPGGAKIGTSTTVTNGFRYVSHNGLGGWMSEAYIGFGDGGGGPVPAYQTTTANLNLREQPSTSAKILLVIPAGSKVVPNGAAAYDFAQVTYNGVKGWVATAYLK
jgi:D-alanyl-D-alanine carboxypeptidase